MIVCAYQAEGEPGKLWSVDPNYFGNSFYFWTTLIHAMLQLHQHRLIALDNDKRRNLSLYFEDV